MERNLIYIYTYTLYISIYIMERKINIDVQCSSDWKGHFFPWLPVISRFLPWQVSRNFDRHGIPLDFLWLDLDSWHLWDGVKSKGGKVGHPKYQVPIYFTGIFGITPKNQGFVTEIPPKN